MTRSLNLLILLVCILFFTSCISDDIIELLPEDEISEEDYLLYSLALDRISQYRYMPDNNLVILQPSSKFSYARDDFESVNYKLCDWYFNLNEMFFDDYLPLQLDVIDFGFGFSMPQDYLLISLAEYETVFEFNDILTGESWIKFKEIYGEGFYSLNRILYNETKDYAVFEISYVCNNLCGHGFIVDADKVEGTWEVCVNETWVS